MTLPEPCASSPAPFGRRHVLLALLAAPLWRPAQAELTMQERLPLVQRRATWLRATLLRPTLDPRRIEADYTAALRQAEQMWEAGRGDDAIRALGVLQKYAPIAELPFIKAQLLLAAIAEHQHNTDLMRHHRAFATALVRAIDASGDGRSATTALRLVLPSEADAWLIAHGERYTALGKRPPGPGRHTHDVWRVRGTDGRERDLYFDVSAMLRPVRPARRVSPAKPAAAAR
ncbi:MAG TPA: hypothetical protein VGE70_01940 [Burkholderiaceae bacterium]